MTGPRVTVEEIKRGKPRPVASPASTFIQPGPSRTAEVTRGLASLSGELDGLANLLERKTFKRETEAGVNAAAGLREEFKTFEEAVAAGRISETENPYFVAAVKTQFGRHAADQYLAALNAMESSELGNEMDTQLFQERAAEIRKEMLDELGIGEKDTDFLRGFTPRADSHLAARFQNQLQITSARAKSNAAESLFTIVTTDIVAGLAIEMDNEEIGKDLSDEARLFVPIIGGTLANNRVTDAIVALAEEHLNIELLKILDFVDTGNGKVSGTRYATAAIAKARAFILARLDSQGAMQDRIDQREKDDAVTAFLTSLNDEMLADGFVLTSDFIMDRQREAQEAGLPEMVDTMNALAARTDDRAMDLDPEILWDWVGRVYSNEESLTQLRHQVTRPNAIAELGEVGMSTVLSHISAREEAAAAAPGSAAAYGDQYLAKELSRLRKNLGEIGIMPGNLTEGDSIRITSAEHELENEYFSWRRGEGAEATTNQIRDFLQNAVEIVTERFRADQLDAKGNPFVPERHADHLLVLDPEIAQEFTNNAMAGITTNAMIDTLQRYQVPPAQALKWFANQLLHTLFKR